jgi:hypothetical protein
MPKKDDIIEPLDGDFESVTKSIIQSNSGLKEIDIKSNTIKHLPSKTAGKEIDPLQGTLNLTVNCQKEIHGIGMGVLSDGTPFLTQRGLARLCGVENAHIGTISTQWSEYPEKPRITKVKELLASRGLFIEEPHIVLEHDSKPLFAYPDSVCLAILEYYAFEAGGNAKDEARKNFRILAGKALQDFIYTQVGYDPDNSVPVSWRQFHDRVSLTYDSVPDGYFGVFKEISDMIVTLGQAGAHIDSSFVPDISVGLSWSKHWHDNNLAEQYGERARWDHNYPDYFPQSASNPQPAWCYPDAALAEFRRWMRETYIGEGKFVRYIQSQVKKNTLPASFVQLAISAYTDNE